MDFDTDNELETKAGVPSHDAVVTHRELMRIFDAYKETNDERLAEIERGRGDPLLEEKLERINTDLNRKIDALTLKHARPALGRDGAAVRSQGAIEHKAAFDDYVRRGESAGLSALETKALSVGSDPDGGYLVPEEIERAVGRRLTAISPIRSIAGIREISANVYKKPFMTTGPAAAGSARPRRARRPTRRCSPSCQLSGDGALRHAGGDRDAAWRTPPSTSTSGSRAKWSRRSPSRKGKAFVTGDGTNKPKGFLSYTNVANASWTWGNIGYIASGAAGAFPASDPSDVLVDLIYALKAGYRQNGHFVMNRKTQSVVRKFKDSGGTYLWQPPAVANGRATLMTFPLVEAEDMPDIAANSYSIAFGDFRRGYLVVDRAGRARAARSLHGEALRAVLHDQARGRRRAGFRRDQAREVRDVVRRRHKRGHRDCVLSPRLRGEGMKVLQRGRARVRGMRRVCARPLTQSFIVGRDRLALVTLNSATRIVSVSR